MGIEKEELWEEMGGLRGGEEGGEEEGEASLGTEEKVVRVRGEV